MLARLAATRLVPRLVVVPVRYSSGEGSIAQSKEFGKKERAEEEYYARQHDLELLEKLKDQIEKKKTELDSLEQEHHELQKKKSE